MKADSFPKPNAHDAEYEALKIIDQRSGTHPSQREIAGDLNMSVGMTNSIIRKLAAKGWLMIRRINGRNLSYVLTPEGTRELARRSYRFVRRTIGDVVRWKEAVDQCIAEGKKRGCTRVVLFGSSELDFLVEHGASRHGLTLVKTLDTIPGRNTGNGGRNLLLFGEKLDGWDEDAVSALKSEPGYSVWLSTILSRDGYGENE